MITGDAIEAQVLGYSPAFLAVSLLVFLGVLAWARKWRSRALRAAALAAVLAFLVAPTLAVGGHGAGRAPFCFTFGYFLKGVVDPGAFLLFAVVPFCVSWLVGSLTFLLGELLYHRLQRRAQADAERTS